MAGEAQIAQTIASVISAVSETASTITQEVGATNRANQQVAQATQAGNQQPPQEPLDDEAFARTGSYDASADMSRDNQRLRELFRNYTRRT